MASPGQQLIHLPFAATINEALQSELVDPASGAIVLENVRQQRGGALSKRWGFSVGNGDRFSGSRTSGYKLISAGLQQLVIDAVPSVDCWSSTATRWSNRGRLPEAGLRTMRLPSPGGAATVEDIEYCNGYLAVSWRVTWNTAIVGGGGAAYVAILDATTGAVVYPPTELGTGSGDWPLLACVDNRYLVVVDETSTTLELKYIDTATPADVWGGWVTLQTVTAAVGNLRGSGLVIALTAVTGAVVVAYSNDNAATNRITVARVAVPAGTLTSTAPATANAVVNALDVACTPGDTVWIAWSTAAAADQVILQGQSPAVITSTMASQVSLMTVASSPVTLIGVAPSATAGRGRAFVNHGGTDTRMTARSFVTTLGAAVASGAATVTIGAEAIGRPFTHNALYYLPVRGPEDGTGDTQRNGVLVDVTDPLTSTLRPVACLGPHGLVVKASSRKAKCAVGSVATTRYFGLALLATSDAYASVAARVDFVDNQRWQSCAHGGVTCLTGGVLTEFDGVRVAEQGFLMRPSTPYFTTAGTGITAATGWKYVAVYSEMDSAGRWCQSGVSDPGDTGPVADDTVSVYVLPPAITARRRDGVYVMIDIYRTVDGGAPPYYYVGSISADASVNVPFSDAVPDATLVTRRKLYAPNLTSAVGAPLDRRSPGAITHAVSVNGALVGAQDRTLWCSGQQVGGEGTWFSLVLSQEIDDVITALAAHDGTLFAFTRRSVYAVAVEAPSDDGTRGGMSSPRLLASDVGCIDGRSVVTTQLGTFFQSERGIELLTRSHEVQWVGQAVQGTLAAYPICVAATLDASDAVVVFELAASEAANQVAGTGRSLVYDLAARGWVSTDRRRNNAGTADTPAQSAARVYTGSAWRYAWLGTDGRVYTESRSSYLDGSAWVTARVETAWVKTAGLQGLQHVNRTLLLAQRSTDHDLSLSLAYNYGGYQAARVFTNAELSALAPAIQVEHPMHDDARCESVRVKVEDATPSTGSVGSGAGGTWIGLTLEVVPQQGAYRLPDGAR